MFNRLFKLERFLFLIIPRPSLHTPFPKDSTFGYEQRGYLRFNNKKIKKIKNFTGNGNISI